MNKSVVAVLKKSSTWGNPKTGFFAAVSLFTTAIASTPAIVAYATNSKSAANAPNIKVLPIGSSSQPLTVAVSDRKSHLIDFSHSNRVVTGVWVNDPKEFASSFKVESVNNDPRMLAFTGVVGGSSKFTANLITVDTGTGEQYIQPIRLIKQSSNKNITEFIDPNTVAATLNNESSNSSIPQMPQAPGNIANPAAANDLERGAKAAVSMQALVDPDLKTRVVELIAAAKSGQDLNTAAGQIGISPQYVARLISLGQTNQTDTFK
jgi:hypothetical protein